MGAMDKNFEQAQSELFAEWTAHLERGGEKFYGDGLARGSRYFETQPRILYLLKEVNADKRAPAWNLFDVVGDGSIGPTWTVLTHWTYGIVNKGLAWEDVPQATPERRREAISRLAVVNVNKCAGGASSEHGHLWAAAYRDREFLRRQVRLYRPNIIIACGVGDIAKHLLFEEFWTGWNITPVHKMYWMRLLALDAVLVSAHHPQARVPHEQLYEEVVLGLKEMGAIGST